jgi:hypothetical protein
MQTETESHKVNVNVELYKELEQLAKNKDMTVEQYVDFLLRPATVFNSEPQPDPHIEIHCAPENYEKLTKWIGDHDFISVHTGADNKAFLMNERILWQNNHPNAEDNLGGHMLQVRVELFSPFADFIRQYLAYFGDKKTLQEFCMEAVYDKVRAIEGDLRDFTRDKKHLVSSMNWYEKFPAMVHGDDSEEEEEENDC